MELCSVFSYICIVLLIHSSIYLCVIYLFHLKFEKKTYFNIFRVCDDTCGLMFNLSLRAPRTQNDFLLSYLCLLSAMVRGALHNQALMYLYKAKVF